ncbi:MAG: hypothetical protein RIM99_15170 [Cyclobacteriaceae bacterium]
MRKITIIMASLIGLTSYGQVQKGDISIGANFGLIKHTGEADILNYSYSNASMAFQYYVSDNVSIGISPGFSSAKVLNNQASVKDNAINLFIDYSFLSKNGKTLPYAGAAVTFYNTKSKFDLGDLLTDGNDDFDIFGFFGGSSEIETNYKRTIISAIFGMKFFITERLNVDNKLTIGTTIDEKIELDILGISASDDGKSDGILTQFTLGFGYIIGRKGT